MPQRMAMTATIAITQLVIVRYPFPFIQKTLWDGIRTVYKTNGLKLPLQMPDSDGSRKTLTIKIKRKIREFVGDVMFFNRKSSEANMTTNPTPRTIILVLQIRKPR